MNRIKAIIVDDEPGAREVLESHIAQYCKHIELVDSCRSVAVASQSIRVNDPDLVFLDINMPRQDGFELLKIHGDKNFKTIFTTAYDQYALKAIKFSALDYLLKPIDIDELVAAVAKVSKPESNTALQIEMLCEQLLQQKGKPDKIILPTTKGFLTEYVDQIIRAEAENNYTVFIFANGRQEVVSRTLKYYEDLLQPLGFFRIHQSHLINMKHVKRYSKNNGSHITMSDNHEVAVARNKRAEFIELLLAKMIH
ncbi:MAG: LytTR family DNA-binding domain-containing protein [Bacteroidota bacterium]